MATIRLAAISTTKQASVVLALLYVGCAKTDFRGSLRGHEGSERNGADVATSDETTHGNKPGEQRPTEIPEGVPGYLVDPAMVTSAVSGRCATGS